MKTVGFSTLSDVLDQYGLPINLNRSDVMNASFVKKSVLGRLWSSILMVLAACAIGNNVFAQAELVSVEASGVETANDTSLLSAVTPDGRYVVFVSSASNLSNVPDHNGNQDVYLRDRQTGVTTLISINAAGTAAGNGYSDSPAITPDGRYVLFTSFAPDISALPDSNGQSDVFVRDVQAGTTILVSANHSGSATGNSSSSALTSMISDDGRFVVFESNATDLTLIPDTNNTKDIFRRDIHTGETKIASINSANNAAASGFSFFSARRQMSLDGRYVVYTSTAEDIVANDNNNQQDVFLRDFDLDESVLISKNISGTGSANSFSGRESISEDGRYVVFGSPATNLVNFPDGNGTWDVFLHDRQTETTSLLSTNSAGTSAANGPSGQDQVGGPAIFQGGRYVVFHSFATDLVVSDTNGDLDIFIKDMQTGDISLVSANVLGNDSGNGMSFLYSVGLNYFGSSTEGPLITFVSLADDLTNTPDSNGQYDVFLRDVNAGTTSLVSVNSAGSAAASDVSAAPFIATNGRALTFRSNASDVSPLPDNNGRSDVFIVDLAPTDSDGDGVLDVDDNCIDDANPGQIDTDLDGAGDACDVDDDNDGVEDSMDNCPTSFGAGPDQTDADGDGVGDICDSDQDGDGVDNALDNCPTTSNPFQTDTDLDGHGDECDADDDNDGIPDVADGTGNGPDNCPVTPNPSQDDLDGDGFGDACDADLDGDGVNNTMDNCPVSVGESGDQTDTDLDGLGDVCDEDDDNDSVADGDDNCPLVVNPLQSDTDSDGVGDACNSAFDMDGDNWADALDNCPAIPNGTQADFDGDGIGDVCDSDADNDGVENEGDTCPQTTPGELVNPEDGCSLPQSCPCEGPRGSTVPWKNHGKYVSCVAHSTKKLVTLGLMSNAERSELVAEAAQSTCGK